jgi:hypothetical protein
MSSTAHTDATPPDRPRASWKPRPTIRACLACGIPRMSTSPSDRMHARCRPAGENDGERAALVLPGSGS